MKTPPGSCVAFAVCSFFFAEFPCGAAGDKPPAVPPLAVVRTWDDLVAQKPVMIQPPAQDGKPAPAPVACKLGISDATGEHCGGVVLYCLIEHDGDEVGPFCKYDALGPFLIHIQIGEPGDIQLATEDQKRSRLSYAKKPGAESAYLYMKTIPLTKLEDYHIEVREVMDDAKPSRFKPVAKATVKVLEKQGSPWSAWSDPDKQPEDTRPDVTPGEVDDGDYSLMIVANPAGGAAIPEWQGDDAVVIAKMPGGKLPLPQITPAEVDPGIQLSMKGNLLTVKLADDQTSTYYPDECFLTRWWVNGKPVQHKTDAPGIKWPRALAAAEKLVKEVRFQVEFHPDRLGVKKGDKVGVQLLFCPKGWECSSGEMADMAKAIMLRADDKPEPWRIARMSNKVEFVYSGDPASVAQ